mgnify:CR=1 FL=1
MKTKNSQLWIWSKSGKMHESKLQDRKIAWLLPQLIKENDIQATSNGFKHQKSQKITKIKGNGEKISMLNWLSDPDSVTPITSWAYSKESKPNKQKNLYILGKNENLISAREKGSISRNTLSIENRV